MLIEIWSDVVCPWCWVGKRRLEAALAGFDHAGEVTIRWRSFQLDPSAPVSDPDVPGDLVGHLADKYGGGREAAREMVDRMTGVAADAGLDFHLDRAAGRSTTDAHRLLHAVADPADGYRLQGALKERLLRAYLSEGERVDDPAVLARLAVEAGVDADLAAAVLASDAHAQDVEADQAEAAAMGASGVPFFVVDRRYGISGAQPAELFTQALERAWAERSPVTLLAGAAPRGDQAPGCGPDGCRV